MTARLGQYFDLSRLGEIASQVTKEEVEHWTVQHNEQVVILSAGYQKTREVFAERHVSLVWGHLLNV